MRLSICACLFFLFLICFSCNSKVQETENWRHVGDIAHEEFRDGDFKLCYDHKYSIQYFSGGKSILYEGEKSAIIMTFKEQYKPVQVNQSGWVRIRFMVNCQLQTGRFRITESDVDYQPMNFDAAIIDQLLEITQSLDGWLPIPNGDEPRDYYQYLIFKIENGHLTEILP